MRAAGFLLAAGLLAAGPAPAQSLPDARAFVTGLYDAYRRYPGPDYLGRHSGAVFSPDLIALIRREAASTPQGDVGALDGDPICDCQDWRISDVAMAVSASGPGAAAAEVRFRNAGRPQTVRLDLVSVRGRWRVGDVHSETTPSLVQLLRQSIARNAPKGRP